MQGYKNNSDRGPKTIALLQSPFINYQKSSRQRSESSCVHNYSHKARKRTYVTRNFCEKLKEIKLKGFYFRTHSF